MKKQIMTLLLLALTSTSCATSEPTGGNITLEDLQHHRWVLEAINKLALPEYAKSLGFSEPVELRKIPELDFGEGGHVAGNMGCNQFKTQVQVENNTLKMGMLATTMMACADFSGELELQLTRLYNNSFKIKRNGETLLLIQGDVRLEYKLVDWVQ